MTDIHIPIIPMRIEQCKVVAGFAFTFIRSLDPVADVLQAATVVQS